MSSSHAEPPRVAPTLPFPRLLSGHLSHLGADKLEFFERCEREFDLVRLRVYYATVYVVSCPKLVGEILAEKDASFKKAASLRLVRRVFGQGLLLAEGDLWRRQHQLLHHYFQPPQVARHAETVERCIEEAVARWPLDQTIDLYEALTEITLDISCKTLLAVDAERVRGIIDRVNLTIQAFNRKVEKNPLPFADLLPTTEARAYRSALSELDSITYRIIDERRASSERHGDILSALIDMRDDSGTPLSNSQIRDELVGLFLGGHETTASAMAWAFRRIGQKPEVEERIAVELDEHVGLDGRLTPETLRRCSYLQGAVHETLRLYPSIAFIGREVRESCRIGGYPLERKDVVLIPQWAIQRSEKHYERPLEFEPDRWAPAARRSRPKWSYFPFGGGSRVCIGQHFVTFEAAMILAGVLRRVRFRPQAPHVPRPEALLTLVPAPNSFLGKVTPRAARSVPSHTEDRNTAATLQSLDSAS